MVLINALLERNQLPSIISATLSKGSGAGEVDEGVDGVGVGEGDLGGVAYVEAFGALDDFAFHGWVEDADEGAFGVGAGDDALEMLTDLVGEGYGGYAFFAWRARPCGRLSRVR